LGRIELRLIRCWSCEGKFCHSTSPANDQVKWAATASPQIEKAAETPLHLNALLGSESSLDQQEGICISKRRSFIATLFAGLTGFLFRDASANETVLAPAINHPKLKDFNQFAVLHGKTILRTEFLMGAVVLHLTDGSQFRMTMCLPTEAFNSFKQMRKYQESGILTFCGRLVNGRV